MSYRGIMDGWQGDEFECEGYNYCGHCEECEKLREQEGDREYESFINE